MLMSKHEVCSRARVGVGLVSPSVHRAGSVFLLSALKGHTATVESLLIRRMGGRGDWGTAAVPLGASVRSSSAPTHKRCVCAPRGSSGCAGGPGPHGEQASNLFPSSPQLWGGSGWGGQTELSMTHGLVPRLPENKHNGRRHTMAPAAPPAGMPNTLTAVSDAALCVAWQTCTLPPPWTGGGGGG